MSQSKNWGGGSTWQWRKTRRLVLDRDGWRCRIMLPGVCKGRADCVHHLDGKALGDDPERLVAACSACNQKIGDPNKVPSDPQPRPRTAW